MTAALALRLAQHHGLRLSVVQTDLVLEAERKPPVEVLDLLARHKAELLALLRPAPEWSAEEWQAYFDERAGVREFDGGLLRPDAEAAAYADILEERLRQHPSDAARQQRETEARATLEAKGIRDPAESPDDFGKIGAG